MIYRFGKSLKPFRRPWLWAGMWCMAIAAVVIGSLSSPPQLPEVPSGDKWLHFTAYFVLAASAVQLFARWSALLGAGIGLVLLGIGLEYAQGALTVDRMMDAGDALANTLGVIAGLGVQLTPWRDLLLRFDRRGGQSS